MMTLNDWLNYIGQLHTSAIDLGLQRILPLASALNVTNFSCPVIVVGGTNGKGSVMRTLEMIYLAAGYHVAAYTSPHLLSFNERLRINGQDVSDAFWIDAFAKTEMARNSAPLSFFEFTTLAALLICQQQKLDVVLLEIGLGGRLDAVNIVNADLAVVTNVDIDHIQWLGDDREKIGLEKAGIFRASGKAICGDPEPPQSLLNFAREQDVELYCFEKDYYFTLQENAWSWHGPNQSYPHLPLPHLKLQNVATAMMAIELMGLPVTETAIIQGIGDARLAGRYEIYSQPTHMIFDVAHNPQSAYYLAERFALEKVQGQRYAVVGMLKDKDIHSTLLPFIKMIDRWFVASLYGLRGTESIELSSILTQNGVAKCEHFMSVAFALEAALAASKPEDIILVFGSFHTVAEAKKLLEYH